MSSHHHLIMDGMSGFGYTVLNNNREDAALGNFWITEIVGLQVGPFQAELDLYWNTDTALRDVMKKHGGRTGQTK